MTTLLADWLSVMIINQSYLNYKRYSRKFIMNRMERFVTLWIGFNKQLKCFNKYKCDLFNLRARYFASA